MDDADVKAAVAVLENEVKHVTARVEEVRAEVRSSMTGVNAKLDGIAQQLIAYKERMSMRNKVVSTFSHIGAGALPIALAKLLHIPLNLG